MGARVKAPCSQGAAEEDFLDIGRWGRQSEGRGPRAGKGREIARGTGGTEHERQQRRYEALSDAFRLVGDARASRAVVEVQLKPIVVACAEAVSRVGAEMLDRPLAFRALGSTA